jgi:hypothetical protein
MRGKSSIWLIGLLLLAAVTPWLRAQSGGAAKERGPASSAASLASPLPRELEVRRLILLDGSYQAIAKYEVKGDRVSYLSAERYEWEEIPTSLIDWPATEKYAREHGSGTLSRGGREADAEEQAERQREAALTPEVAPRLRLPRQGGVYLLDVFQQQATLTELVQNGGEVKRNTGKNVLHATVNPLASARQTIELPGAHARVQSHVGNPYIYVNLDDDPDDAAGKAAGAQAPRERFRIVRAESDAKKNTRVVGAIRVAMYGKVSQQQKYVAATVEPFSGPWVKLTPAEPLPPGEYAVVELLGEKQEMNLYVWDFGVDPRAPANPNSWRAAPGANQP